MEKFTEDISSTLPTVDEAKESHHSHKQRPSHRSLPKLIIYPHQGPVPEEIPPHAVEYFLQFTTTYRRAPPLYLMPLPVHPTSPTWKTKANSSKAQWPHAHPDPYLEDPPTPAEMQFTEIEAEVIQEWKEIKEVMTKEANEAMDKYQADPRDTQAKEEVRRLRKVREENADAIAQIHERRRIRRNFRKDFNHLAVGW